MTTWQSLSVSVGGAFIVVAILGLGALTARETCRDFNQAMVVIGDQSYSVALAQNDAEKVRGLIGCKAMPKNSGMYFTYSEPTEVTYWMKGMSMPIDIVWVANGKVVGIEHDLPTASQTVVNPPLYRPAGQVDGVLEVGAGKALEYGIKEGSIITLLKR